jgi:hypothetical protein
MLKAGLERLRVLGEQNEKTHREMESLRQSVNSIARRLQPQQATAMAQQFGQVIATQSSRDDSQIKDLISAMAKDVSRITNSLEQSRADPAAARKVDEALAGAAGAAIVRLDFASANAMLDSLGRIEAKLDTLVGAVPTPPGSQELALMLSAEKSRAEATWIRFVAAGGTTRCPNVNTRVEQTRKAFDEAHSSGNFLSAQRLSGLIQQEALPAAAELETNRRLAEVASERLSQMRAQVDYERRRLDEEILRLAAAVGQLKDRRDRDSANHGKIVEQNNLNWKNGLERQRAQIEELQKEIARLERTEPATDNDRIIRGHLLMQNKSMLSLTQSKLDEGIMSRQLQIQNDESASAALLQREPQTDPQELSLRNLTAARERLSAALSQTGAADPTKPALALDALESARHDAQYVRNGREPPPRTRNATAAHAQRYCS